MRQKRNECLPPSSFGAVTRTPPVVWSSPKPVYLVYGGMGRSHHQSLPVRQEALLLVSRHNPQNTAKYLVYVRTYISLAHLWTWNWRWQGATKAPQQFCVVANLANTAPDKEQSIPGAPERATGRISSIGREDPVEWEAVGRAACGYPCGYACGGIEWFSVEVIYRSPYVCAEGRKRFT